jgi:hypothetical protein
MIFGGNGRTLRRWQLKTFLRKLPRVFSIFHYRKSYDPLKWRKNHGNFAMMRHRMLHEKLDATKAPLKLYKLMHHLCCVIVNVSLYPYDYHHEQ